MPNNNYLKTIYDLLHKENLTENDIISSLDFDFRVKMFFEDSGTKDSLSLIYRCNKEKISLFTKEEFEKLEQTKGNIIYSSILLPKDVFLRQLLKGVSASTCYDDEINFNNLTEEDAEKVILNMIDTNIFDLPTVSKIFHLLKDDYTKEELLNKLMDKWDIFEMSQQYYASKIICGFESDELKKKWMRHLFKGYRTRVIHGFQNDKKKIPYLFRGDKSYRENILMTFNNEEVLKKLLLMPNISKKGIIKIKD